MATAKYGVKCSEWWKHLKEEKRTFAKAVRKKSKQQLKKLGRQTPRVGGNRRPNPDNVKLSRIFGEE